MFSRKDAGALSCCKFWIYWVGVNTKFTPTPLIQNLQHDSPLEKGVISHGLVSRLLNLGISSETTVLSVFTNLFYSINLPKKILSSFSSVFALFGNIFLLIKFRSEVGCMGRGFVTPITPSPSIQCIWNPMNQFHWFALATGDDGQDTCTYGRINECINDVLFLMYVPESHKGGLSLQSSETG